MQKINIGILGYSDKYNKFLKNIKRPSSNYNLKFLIKKNELNNKLFNQKLIKSIEENTIKFLIICDKSVKNKYLKKIDFLIEKKIVIVQASTNYEIDNHGFITKKLFKDFSFEDIFLRKTLKLKINETKKFIKNKIILITGGAGSIGGFLAKNLIQYKPKKVFIIDNNEYNIFKLKNIINHKKLNQFSFKILNIENYSSLNSAFKEIKPNIVFNAAALKHVNFLEENPNQGLRTNYIGTKNVLSACRKNKINFFIHVSTDKAANPINNLGITKFLSELICHQKTTNNKTKVGIVRFGNVFDSYGSVSEIFKNNILNSKKIKISNSEVERFFMSKDEAANFLIYACHLLTHSKKNSKTRTFIYDMGKPIKIIDLAKKIIFLSGRPYQKFLSNKFYGLNKVEKISENLLSKHELKTATYDNLINEIINKKDFSTLVDFMKIDKIIESNDDFKSKNLINRLKKIFN